MKKIFVLSALLIIVPCLIFSQEVKEEYFAYTNDQGYHTLQAITEWNNEFLGKSTETTTLLYDSEGRITNMSRHKYSHQKDKTLSYLQTTFQYDTSHRLIQESQTDQDKHRVYTIDYQYAGNYLSRQVITLPAEKKIKTTLYRPDQKVLSSYNSLMGQDIVLDSYTNIYDSHSNVIRMINTLYGSVSSVTENSYTPDHRLASSISTNAQGQVLSRMTFEYDEQGNMLSLSFISAYTPAPLMFSYEYNKSGQKTREINSVYETEYQYSRTEKLLKSIKKKLDGTVEEIRTYDKSGNLISIENPLVKSKTLIRRYSN